MMTYKLTSDVSNAYKFKDKAGAKAVIITGTAPMIIWVQALSSYVLCLRNKHYVQAIEML